jgi:hypothetical protein
MDDGVAGFIVDNEDQAVQAVERVPALSRRRCREVFEKRFSAARMARDYLRVYRKLITGAGAARDGNGHAARQRRRPAVTTAPDSDLLRPLPR